jgi:hypothetical protein
VRRAEMLAGEGRSERVWSVVVWAVLLCGSVPLAWSGDRADPPNETARRAVETLELELGENDYWTEDGVLARGVVCLSQYDWAAEEPWIAPFQYEWLLQTKRTRVESIPRYTVEMVAEHASRLRDLPWVRPSALADSQLVLGWSHGWLEDKPLAGWQMGDPVLPPQKVFGYVITDPDSPDVFPTDAGETRKIRVVLVAGNHPVEMHGDWALHGMISFLVSDDPRAATLRRKAVFYVYPMVNPDGRYLQVRRPTVPADLWVRTRGNPELHAAGEGDHNRVWTTGDRFSTIRLVTAAMRADTGGQADYLWDFHGGYPHNPGDYRTTAAGHDSPYARALVARQAPYPEVLRRTSSGAAAMLRSWAMTPEGLNVPYSFTFEPGCQLDKRGILRAGKALALGFHDVVTGQAPLPPGPPEPDPDLVARQPTAPVLSWRFQADCGPRGSTGEPIPAQVHQARWSDEPHFTDSGNQALVLDGSATYADLGHPSAVVQARSLTVAAWVRGSDRPGSTRYLVSRWQPGGNQRTWALVQHQGTRSLNVLLTPAGSFARRKNYVSTFPVFDGNWRHVAFTYQPAESSEQDGKLRVFVDGVELRDGAGLEVLDDDPVPELLLAAAPLLVGAWTEPGRFFQGELDELAIWDSALDGAQIKWLAENSLLQRENQQVVEPAK